MSEFAQFYPSLTAFYAADRRRRHSRERDVGLVWRGAAGARGSLVWFLDRTAIPHAAAA